MSGSGLHAYAPLLLHLLIAIGLAGLLTTLSLVIGWRRPNRAKLQAYECGMEPTAMAAALLSVNFWLESLALFLFNVTPFFMDRWPYFYPDVCNISPGFGLY